MTERLYYNDSFLREFDAQVISCEPVGAGGSAATEAAPRWQVTLDRTAFYPTSGGQPFDVGQLGPAKIVEVADRGNDIVHVTDRALEPGAVRGTIDWRRRFDHMQQHTGQHLLSSVFIQLFRIQTVSFHLGNDVSTIDLATPSLSAEQLEAAERLSNEIIFEDRPVTIQYGTAAELAARGVRKEVEREGILRAIQIENIDLQPCGGTHVARTGQIGMTLLRGTEKMKGNCRLEFVCGERARRAAGADRNLLNESARELTCAAAELPRGIARIIEERNSANRLRQRFAEELSMLKAKTLLAEVVRQSPSQSPRMIVEIFADAEMDYLRQVATNLVAEPNVVALLASQSTGQIVFAQSSGLPGDMNKLLRQLVVEAGGKGGGSTSFAQGSVKDVGSLNAMMDRAREAVSAVYAKKE
jgi:alanyl-tRNA synthetase